MEYEWTQDEFEEYTTKHKWELIARHPSVNRDIWITPAGNIVSVAYSKVPNGLRCFDNAQDLYVHVEY